MDVNAAMLEHARRRGRQLRVDLWQDPRAGLEQPKTDLVAPNARIKAQHVVGKRGELTDQFYANQSSANDDNRQTLAPLRRVRGCVRAFEAFDQVISQHQRIRHRLERQGVRRAGNQPVVRRCAKRDNQMVVGQAVRAAFGGHGSNELSFEINGFHCGLDEAGSSQRGANRLRAMPQLQAPGAGLEQERRQHEEVLAAHERLSVRHDARAVRSLRAQGASVDCREPKCTRREVSSDPAGLDLDGDLVFAIDRVEVREACSLKNMPMTIPRNREISGTVIQARRRLEDRP
jgi:hypothetical protein